MKGDFTVKSSEIDRLQQKSGRGSTTKPNVGIIAESFPLEDIEIKVISKQCYCFKAKALNDHKAEGINAMIKDFIEGKKYSLY